MSTKVQIKVPKWLFIHIPKTGGTFFKRSLNKDAPVENMAHAFPYSFTVNGWHPRASVYKVQPWLENMSWHKYYKPNYKVESGDPDYVTVIRNPFAMLYSYWRYVPKDMSDWDSTVSGFANCNNIMNTHTFHDFVEHYIDPEKEWHIPPLKGNLYAQIYKSDRTTLIPKMENILRCEHLAEDLKRWADKNDIATQEVPMDRRNVNPIRDTYKGKYTLLQIHQLEEIWEEQLTTFNYHYKDPD